MTERVVPVTVLFDPELLAKVDLIVAERKLSAAAANAQYRSTSEQKTKAVQIAEKQGVAAANAYLKSLKPAPVRVSRISVLHELIEAGVVAREAAREAEQVASQPAKPKGRR